MHSITSFRAKTKTVLENGPTKDKKQRALGLDNLITTELSKIPQETC